MVQAYFEQTKTRVDQYAATDFMLDARVDFETPPGEQSEVRPKVKITKWRFVKKRDIIRTRAGFDLDAVLQELRHAWETE